MPRQRRRRGTEMAGMEKVAASGIDRKELTLEPTDPEANASVIRQRRYARLKLSRNLIAVTTNLRENFRLSIPELNLGGGIGSGERRRQSLWSGRGSPKHGKTGERPRSDQQLQRRFQFTRHRYNHRGCRPERDRQGFCPDKRGCRVLCGDPGVDFVAALAEPVPEVEPADHRARAER